MAERDPRAIQSSAAMKNYCSKSSKPDKYSLHLASLSRRFHLMTLASTEKKEKIRARLRLYLSMSAHSAAFISFLKYILKYLDRVIRIPGFYGSLQALSAPGGGGMHCSGSDSGRAPPFLLSFFPLSHQSSALTDVDTIACSQKMGIEDDTIKEYKKVEKKPGLMRKIGVMAAGVVMALGIHTNANAVDTRAVQIQNNGRTESMILQNQNGMQTVHNPRTGETYNVSGNTIVNQNGYQGHINGIDQANRDHTINNYVGAGLTKENEYQQKIKEYDSLIKLDPSNFNLYFHKAELQYNFDKQESIRTSEYLINLIRENRIKVKPQEKEKALNQLASTYINSGQKDKGLPLLKELNKEFPKEKYATLLRLYSK
ncbi:MAG: hypothetical protein HZB62_04960 [Nitrospirae bacterium]|nr:hypothetical protein [Nitrospirota bacterium]